MSFKLTIGRVAKAGVDLYTNEAIVAVSGKEGSADNQWLYHALPRIASAGVLDSAVKGNTLNKRKLEELEVDLPPLPEQRRIAKVLDTVDDAIRSTEALIAKLEQTLHGLRYSLLSSGGSAPTQWNVRPLGELVDSARPIVYGILMPGKGWPGGVPVIKVKDIQGGVILQDELLLTSPGIDEKYHRSRVQADDLLFTIRGTVGRMAFVPQTLADANITQDTARIAITEAERRYVWYYLQMPIPQSFIEMHTLGQAVKGINLRDVRRIPIALPPRDEQKKIAQALDVMSERIRCEIDQARLLRFIRQGLMDDLLTGRVRASSST